MPSERPNDQNSHGRHGQQGIKVFSIHCATGVQRARRQAARKTPPCLQRCAVRPRRDGQARVVAVAGVCAQRLVVVAPADQVQRINMGKGYAHIDCMGWPSGPALAGQAGSMQAHAERPQRNQPLHALQRVLLRLPVPHIHGHRLRQGVVRRQAHAARQGSRGQQGTQDKRFRHVKWKHEQRAQRARHVCSCHVGCLPRRPTVLLQLQLRQRTLRLPPLLLCENSPPGAQRDEAVPRPHQPVGRRVQLRVPGEVVVQPHHQRICSWWAAVVVIGERCCGSRRGVSSLFTAVGIRSLRTTTCPQAEMTVTVTGRLAQTALPL